MSKDGGPPSRHGFAAAPLLRLRGCWRLPSRARAPTPTGAARRARGRDAGGPSAGEGLPGLARGRDLPDAPESRPARRAWRSVMPGPTRRDQARPGQTSRDQASRVNQARPGQQSPLTLGQYQHPVKSKGGAAAKPCRCGGPGQWLVALRRADCSSVEAPYLQLADYC